MRAVEISLPDPERAGPIIFASPHSGRHYPRDMQPAADLAPMDLRRGEDAFVDRLLAGAPDLGATVISAPYARAYIDLNRDARELDPQMLDAPPDEVLATARVAAGLGVIARLGGDGRPLYDRTLTLREARHRLKVAYRPYHDALRDLVAQAQAQFGLCLLIDWHSMPSAASGADVVLGDRFGAACAPWLTDLADEVFSALDFSVARNTPYAGGFVAETYGRPVEGVHVLQVEMSRSLYLDEATLAETAGLARMAAAIEAFCGALMSAWREHAGAA